MDFTLRIHKYKRENGCLADIRDVTISGITLLSKPSKGSETCMHKGNQKKFGYTIELSRKFLKFAGSHRYPILAFKGEYLDVIVKNFPRYPAFYQCKHMARNIIESGSCNEMNKGFPEQLLLREFEII